MAKKARLQAGFSFLLQSFWLVSAHVLRASPCRFVAQDLMSSVSGPTLISFVSASRAGPDLFASCSPLGLSLRRLQSLQAFGPMDEMDLAVIYRSLIAFENTRGLPDVFNAFIEARLEAQPAVLGLGIKDEVLVFVHDDVWIDDAQIGEHLLMGLDCYDVIGVAGSVQRVPGQPAWCRLNQAADLPTHAMSGMIGHGSNPCGEISYFGPWRQACELLDGVFMAVRLSTLARTALRFDPRFRFHFYDLDFCRAARLLGLRLGTWPIALTHQSDADFGDEWWRCYPEYLAKWGD